MQQRESSVSFRQMEERGNGFGYSLLSVVFGLIFLFAGAFAVMGGDKIASLMMLLGVIFLYLGASMILHWFQRIEIDEEEVRLVLGRRVLARYPVSGIKAMAYGTVRPNVKWDWEPEILILSPQTPEHILSVGRTVIDSAREFPTMHPNVGADAADLKTAVDAYVKARMSRMRLDREDGIWLEYSPDRAKALRKHFPHAQDLIS